MRAALLLIPIALGPGRPAPASAAQSPPPQPSCDQRDHHSFDFTIGHWKGVERPASGGDTLPSSTSEIAVRPILAGCALEEQWRVEPAGRRPFAATLIRGLDPGTGRWRLTYVDDQANNQVYEGSEEAGRWHFQRQRLVDGKPMLVRVDWAPTDSGFRQTIARSADQGRHWQAGSVIEYTRVGPDAVGDIAGVGQAIAGYNEARRTGQAAPILRAFAEAARIGFVRADTIATMSRAEYAARFNGQAPADSSETRLLGLEVSGGSAVARLETRTPALTVVDHLLLLRTGGRWQVIFKTSDVRPKS